MEDPTEGLGEIIGRVDDARDVFQDDVLGILPILDGKVLNINVAGALSRNTSVDHLDSRLVVFVDRSRVMLGKTQLFQNSTEVFGMLRSKNSSKELSFSRAGCSDGLRLGTVRDGAATHSERVAGG